MDKLCIWMVQRRKNIPRRSNWGYSVFDQQEIELPKIRYFNPKKNGSHFRLQITDILNNFDLSTR